MIEGFFLYGVNGETAGAAPGGEHHFISFALAHKAEASLTFSQLTVTGA